MDLCLVPYSVTCTWRSRNAAVLQRSRPAGDLSIEDEEYILDALNCDWEHLRLEADDAFRLTHWCLRWGCPLSCGGRRDRAARHVEAAVLLVAGGPMSTPLLYRWKGFDEASAFAYRARACADLLRRGFQDAYPAATVRKAQEAVERPRAVQGDAGVEVDSATKTCIRAGATIQWMHADKGGKGLDVAIVLNAPLQRYLNGAFAAEKAATAFRDACSTTSLGGSGPAGWAVAREDAIAKNLDILSGRRGERVFKALSEMLLSYDAPGWQALHIDVAEKNRGRECHGEWVCRELVSPLLEVWRSQVPVAGSCCRTHRQPRSPGSGRAPIGKQARRMQQVCRQVF